MSDEPNTPTPASAGTEHGLTQQKAEAILWQLAGTTAFDAKLPELHEMVRSAPHPPEADSLQGASDGHDRAARTTLAEARRHAKNLLHEDKLGDLLEALPDPLLIVNGSGQIVLANSLVEKLLGYHQEELLGQPIELLVPERFHAKHASHRTAYTANPHVRPMGAGLDLSARRKDGREIPVEISLSPLRTEDGVLVMTTIRDVRTRKLAEAQLRKMEARYRTLVEGIPAVTFMAALDDGTNELYVSPQIESLLGFSQKEWLENPVLWHTQLHPEDRQRWHIEFAKTCGTGQPFRSIYRFIARDGRVVWVHGEAKVVRDDEGKPLFLQGVAFDITGMKEAEEELKALNQSLEQRVAERTEIAERRAQELGRSNADLEQFGYIVAHDLRQPLRTIKSYTQKLAERLLGKADRETDDHLTRTINAADRMRVLIDDLLTYSRVGTQGKESVAAECGAAASAACANLEAAIEESKAEVTADPLPTVMADHTQLTQLFQNLIGNALKFRGEQSPRIHVASRREGEHWRISVVDNGIGIEPQYLERIFGLGERLHGASKYPGNGIGLATCEKIVQRHGGEIRAESAGLGQGSTFSFTLPAAPDPASVPPVTPPAVSPR